MQASPTLAWMDNKQHIGKRIRDARKAKRLTQAAVAEHLGIARVNITQWEGGLTGPDRSRLPALSKLLGVTVEWIISGDGAGPSASKSPEDAEFQRLMQDFPDHLKPEALRYLQFLVMREAEKAPPASHHQPDTAKPPKSSRRARS